MKKNIIATATVILAAASLYAASARLDFFDKAGNFFSVLEDDLARLVYLQSENDASGEFSTIRIETKDGEQRTIEMADCNKIAYSPATGLEPFAIEIVTDEHCTVTMLDCVNNGGIIDPAKPEDWHGAESDYLGHFIYSPEYGYEMEVEIIGQYTGKVYTEDPDFVFFVPSEEYARWTDSWGFLMPNEPIKLIGKSTELTTYEGMDFVGTYNGYQICSEPRVASSEEPVLNLELRSNGSYTVKTTDENAYDFHYMYTYDEEKSRADHVVVQRPEYDNYTVYYGATETFLGDDFIYVSVNNYSTGKPEDRRIYLAAKEAFKFRSAANEYGQKYLVEATTGDGATKFVFVDNYGSKVCLAGLDFTEGSHIDETCVAIVSYDGDTQLKYINNGIDNPEFITKGTEAGTYSSADGSTDDMLVLDGFGEALLGDVEDAYTMESGAVIFNGSGRIFNIDTNARTYAEVLHNDTWTGPLEFTIENAKGAYGNNESEKCYASIHFNHDLMGNEKEGYLALRISLWNNNSFSLREVISSCPKYFYNEEAGTVTISGVLVGTGSGYETYRRNLVLRVSEDLKSIWFDEAANGDRIYGVGSPADYFYTGTQNTLTAVVEQPAVSGKYTASFPNIYYMGNPMSMSVPGILAIDQDASGAEKQGYAYFNITAMGMVLYDEVAEYEIVDSKLVLKNIEIGDGNGSWPVGNLEFTITDEGNLQGTGIIYGHNYSSFGYGVNLDEAAFVPEAE